jgi:probable phosphoglycerate mutase
MTSHGKTTRFGLIRHAETVWNRAKRIQGQLDSRLTSDGRRQADSWGCLLRTLDWDRCICSDLARAWETTVLVNRSCRVPASRDAGLREQDWGRWTGRTIARIKQEEPALLAKLTLKGWQFRPPGGEDRLSVWQRGRKVLEDAAEKWPGKNILVVTHEGLIKCLVYRLLRRQFLPSEPRILAPAHLHLVAVNDGRLGVEKLNAVALEGSAAKR